MTDLNCYATYATGITIMNQDFSMLTRFFDLKYTLASVFENTRYGYYGIDTRFQAYDNQSLSGRDISQLHLTHSELYNNRDNMSKHHTSQLQECQSLQPVRFFCDYTGECSILYNFESYKCQIPAPTDKQSRDETWFNDPFEVNHTSSGWRRSWSFYTDETCPFSAVHCIVGWNTSECIWQLNTTPKRGKKSPLEELDDIVDDGNER